MGEYDCGECGQDTRKDLTSYSDAELSLNVMNDEGLYNSRHHMTRDELETMFIFTDDQWNELVQDLEDEEEE